MSVNNGEHANEDDKCLLEDNKASVSAKIKQDAELYEDEKPEIIKITVPTSIKGQKRREIRTNFNKRPRSSAELDAQKKEKERLERLEKAKGPQAPTASNYAAIPIQQRVEETDSDDSDDVQFVVERKKGRIEPEVEYVELSSDEEGALSNQRAENAKKYLSPQKLEEQRARRVRRKSELLDSMDLTAEGRLLVNEGKPEGDPDIFVSPHLTSILQPHQLGGIRFMYDNIIESLKIFRESNGFGCILAHSMGLGKTIQVISFIDIFFRATDQRKVLIICPINVIQNWAFEFEKWLSKEEGKRDFDVFVVGDSTKNNAARLELIEKWQSRGGVLLMGYEMFRLLTLASRRSGKKPQSAVDIDKAFERALVDPGPDLIVCDEGHRIKNLKADVSSALSGTRTRRRIVLTGYPLQNNLMEYFCMVDFVRPMYLGSKKNFSLMFDRPIRNGMCIDSTRNDVKIAKQRIHILTNMLRGFVQRRTHHLLKKILPESREYVLMLRKTPVQKALYKEFVKFIRDEISEGENLNYYNPLKAYAICSKIWNHPDLLREAYEKQFNINSDIQNAEQSSASGSPPQFNSAMIIPHNAQGNIAVNNDYNINQWAYQPPKDAQFYNFYPQESYQSNNQYPMGMGDFQSQAFPQATVPMNGSMNYMSNGTSSEIAKPKAKTKRNGRVKKSANTMLEDDDSSCSYAWAGPIMETYVKDVMANSSKMSIALSIIEATVRRGEKILLFSGSLSTLSKIEEFLALRGEFETPHGMARWKRNTTYFRFDGSTSGTDREKLINRFNASPDIYLFLISTRAGSLGVNLVSASRVIIFDASWNPCHDAQAVCRIYRYGQQNKTYIYRLIMHNCMEKSIFSRQISKHGLQQRVVDEAQIEANVTTKELENLIAYDEVLDLNEATLDLGSEEIEDDLLREICSTSAATFAESPFLHESLMLETEHTLSAEEKLEAELLYEREKKGLHTHTGGLHTGSLSYNVPTFEPGSLGALMGPARYPDLYGSGLGGNVAGPEPSTYLSYSNVPPYSYNGNGLRYARPLLNGYNGMQNPAQRFPNFVPQMRSPPSRVHQNFSEARPMVPRSSSIISHQKIIIDEDVELSCVSQPGQTRRVLKGETAEVVRTTNSGTYLRLADSTICDAAGSKYAENIQTMAMPMHHPMASSRMPMPLQRQPITDVIELD